MRYGFVVGNYLEDLLRGCDRKQGGEGWYGLHDPVSVVSSMPREGNESFKRAVGPISAGDPFINRKIIVLACGKRCGDADGPLKLHIKYDYEPQHGNMETTQDCVCARNRLVLPSYRRPSTAADSIPRAIFLKPTWL